MRGPARVLGRAVLLFAGGGTLLACPPLSELEHEAGALDGGARDAVPERDGARVSDGSGHESSCSVIAPEDASSPLDASSDASACGVASDAGACAPSLPKTFEPSWKPPSAPTHACSSAQIEEAYDFCFGPDSSTSLCNGWMTNNAKCKKCLISPTTDATYGPVVIDVDTGIENLNEGGCLLLLEPCNVACAKDMQASVQCTQDACDPVCPPVVSMSTFDEALACEQRAASCSCQPYTGRALRCEIVVSATESAGGVCVSANTNQAGPFKQVMRLFCGG